MKIQNVAQQQFKGNLVSNVINKYPLWVAGLAGASVVEQKLVMSAGEAFISPAVDIGVGRTLTKVSGEKDGSTNQASKTQAIRTAAQSVGGTISGIIVRAACIMLTSLIVGKLAGKSASAYGKIFNKENINKNTDMYKFEENASAWGKTLGGVIATVVMTACTNFVVDIPVINWFNDIFTKCVNKISDATSKAKEKK